MRQRAEVLTPGFGGPNGPAFPSHAPLSHAQGPHPLSVNGYAPDCCCSLEVDGARPRAPAVILAGRILAQTTTKKKRWTKHRHIGYIDLCCHGRGGEGGLTARGTIVSVIRLDEWSEETRSIKCVFMATFKKFSLALATHLTF